jgi:transmembrane sensor
VSMGRTETIEMTAGEWLARRDSGRLTPADEEQFQAWLDASVAHRVAYLRLEHAWEEAGRLKALGAGIDPSVVPARGQWQLSTLFSPEASGRRRGLRLGSGPSVGRSNSARTGTRHRRRTWAWLSAAAGGSALAAGVVYLLFATLFAGHPYSTAVGGTASIPLSDGSKLTLNTDSEVRVVLSATERRVDLKRGEVFFEVAHDARRPFVVRAGDLKVVAVGTQFSVFRDAPGVRVVVTEGVVRLQGRDRLGNSVFELLPAGMLATTAEGAGSVEVRRFSDADTYLGWLNGTLVFHDVTLAEATREFNRYNTHKLAIEDATVGALRISGSFRSSRESAFVHLLEVGYPVRIEEREGTVLIGAPAAKP